MPSQLHETVARLFQSRPALAVELLAETFGYAVPEHDDIRLISNDLTFDQPTEYHADAVITLTDTTNRPVLAVIIDSQLPPDKDRQWSWPPALLMLRERLRCPTVLVVVSPTDTHYAISIGHPDFVLRPLVVGPDQVAPTFDVEQARRDPERAVLAALLHRDHPNLGQIFRALVTALTQSNHPNAGPYTDGVLAIQSPTARQRLEELMTHTYE